MLLPEEMPKRGDQTVEIVVQPPPGDADHPESERRELEIARTVGLERQPAAVRAIAVQLGYQAVRRPEEVDNEGANTNVDIRLGNAVAAAEAEEAPLQLTAGVVGLQGSVDGKPKEFGLPERAGELQLGKRAAKVGESA